MLERPRSRLFRVLLVLALVPWAQAFQPRKFTFRGAASIHSPLFAPPKAKAAPSSAPPVLVMIREHQDGRYLIGAKGDEHFEQLDPAVSPEILSIATGCVAQTCLPDVSVATLGAAHPE